jgi:hypothetical protein
MALIMSLFVGMSRYYCSLACTLEWWTTLPKEVFNFVVGKFCFAFSEWQKCLFNTSTKKNNNRPLQCKDCLLTESQTFQDIYYILGNMPARCNGKEKTIVPQIYKLSFSLVHLAWACPWSACSHRRHYCLLCPFSQPLQLSHSVHAMF